jgi:hypothetical protein
MDRPEAGGAQVAGETEFVCGVAGWPIAIGPMRESATFAVLASQIQ